MIKSSEPRKSYGQYCGLARALDIVGERWTLLIVRQLLVDPARFGELAEALPGVASNLLTERLRKLVAAGVVERRLDPERNGAMYALTDWGEGLRPAVDALVRWSTPLMISGPGDDHFRPEWLAVALRSFLSERRSTRRLVVGFETAGTVVAVRLDRTGSQVVLDAEAPGTVLRAEPAVVLGLAAGVLDVDTALAMGKLRGSASDLKAVFGD